MLAASLPSAFLTGFLGSLAYHKCEAWLSERGIGSTPATQLAIYAAFVFVPFLVFVVGWNRERWDPDYDWFGEAARAEHRRILVRWGVYWVGVVLAYATR
jgi:hypothetical protein